MNLTVTQYEGSFLGPAFFLNAAMAANWGRRHQYLATYGVAWSPLPEWAPISATDEDGATVLLDVVDVVSADVYSRPTRRLADTLATTVVCPVTISITDTNDQLHSLAHDLVTGVADQLASDVEFAECRK